MRTLQLLDGIDYVDFSEKTSQGEVEVGRSIGALLRRYGISRSQLWRRRRDLALLDGEVVAWFTAGDVEALDCLHLFVSRKDGLDKPTRLFQQVILNAPGEASITEKMFSYLGSRGVTQGQLQSISAFQLFNTKLANIK